MFNIQELVDYVNDLGQFSCDWSKETQPVTQSSIESVADKPQVYIGGLELRRTSDIALTGSIDDYEQYADDLVFTVSIHLITTQTRLTEHWITLHNALLGWTPYDAREKEFSGLTYKQGDMMGLSNARAWWLDQWILSFPAVTLNQT